MKESTWIVITVAITVILASIVNAPFGPIMISISIFGAAFYIVRQLEKK